MAAKKQEREPSAAEDAAAAAERGELEAALGLLLEAWRAKRHERLAALIDLLDAKLAKGRPEPSAGKTIAERQVAWLASEQKATEAERSSLLKTLVEPKRSALAERLRRIDAWPEDPRTGMALTKLFEAGYGRGKYGHWLWRDFSRLIIKEGDPRTLAILRKNDSVQRRGAPFVNAGVNRNNVFGKCAFEIGKRIEVEPLRPEEEEACARMEALFAAEQGKKAANEKTAEDFLRRIREAPADDGLRQVFADWLLERGDERGELINLQLARAAGQKPSAAALKRENALLRAHEKEWIGAIEPALLKDGRVFERGFLQACRTRVGDRRIAESMVGLSEWATVERLDLRGWKIVNRNELILHPVMRALREVEGVWVDLLRDAAKRELPFERVVFEGGEGYDSGGVAEKIEAIGTSASFPALKCLGFESTRMESRKLKAFLESPLGRRLDSLDVTVGNRWQPQPASIETLSLWVVAAMSAGGGTKSFSIAGDSEDGWRLALERDPSGRFSRMEARFGWSRPRRNPMSGTEGSPLSRLRALVAPLALTRLTVTSKVAIGTAADAAALKKALEAKSAELVLAIPDASEIATTNAKS